jgi:hypothetical protein
VAEKKETYPASFSIEYPEKLSRLTTFFRLIWSIPIIVVLSLLTAGSNQFVSDTSDQITTSGGGIVAGLFSVTVLMILFRQRYPRWWFDFALELNRFSYRIGAYLFLLTDKYPSTVDKQSVNLDIEYPNAEKDLNRWLPLVKWFLAIPHYFVLTVLSLVAIFVTIFAWFAIILTGRYPKNLFDFMVGLGRWSVRVEAYAFTLATDKYPPFSLK